MNKQTNVIERTGERPIILDYLMDEYHNAKDWVVFVHGFKGYKDWGAWNLICEEIYKSGFNVLKFNFSGNGGTIEDPIDFPDLDAFAENTYSKEQKDLDDVLDWLQKYSPKAVHLIGHSRGGAAVLLKSLSDKVDKIVSWAGVSDFYSRITEEQVAAWESNGVFYVKNGRTNQMMPMNKTFYDDLMDNNNSLNILENVKASNKSILLIHAKNDPAVSYQDSQKVNSLAQNSTLILLESGGHTFDVKHPWEESSLPEAMEKVLKETLSFLKS